MRKINPQPIHLAKNKRKQNDSTVLLRPSRPDKENIDYDLAIFQDSLKLNKHSNWQTLQEPIQKVYNREVLTESLSLMSNTMKLPRKSTAGQNLKDNFHNSLTVGTPSTQRLEFSKDWKLFKNVHKAPACVKPVKNGSCQAGKGNQSETIVNLICLRSKRGSIQGEQDEHHDPITKKSGPLTCAQASNGADVIGERMELMKKAYEAKINEVMAEKEALGHQVEELRKKAQLQKEEKHQILNRMRAIEEEVQFLQNQHTEIKDIETQIQKIQQDTADAQDRQTQTEPIPLAQLQLAELVEPVRSSTELISQNWLVKAKTFKSELQRQKIHTSNLEAEFKLTLENKEIEWRLRQDRLQKQLQVLNDKYSSKCLQVRDKENLLSRFIVSK